MKKTPFVFLAALFAASLSAQTLPFQLVALDQNQNASSVNNGATLNIVATAVGSKTTISVGATYIGVNQANFGAPSLFGSSAFVIGSLTASTLNPSGSATLPVSFTPTSSSLTTALLTIPYTITGPSGGGPGQGNTPLGSGSITFTLSGGVPQFSLAYYIQGVQNVIPLADGGTLTYPSTQVGGTSQAVVQITNGGSGAGLINNIQVTGSAFTASGIPLLPGALSAGAQLQFTITYTPSKAAADTGALVITFADHTVTVTLAGTGSAASYSYQLVENGQTSNITPGQTLSFSSTPGASVLFTIVVENTGTASGGVSNIVLVGNGYQQVAAPSNGALAPGASLSLDYAFTPPSVGSFPGQLKIGNDSFTLAGAGTGPQLTYMFTIGSVTLTVASGGTVPFSSVQIGQSEFGTFTVQNTGTATANVVSVSIPTAQSAFSLRGAPTAPVTLAPNGSVSFQIGYAPFAAASAGILQIDSAQFNLVGAATSPPALPAYSFQGSGGTVAAMQQTPIGVTLQQPYNLQVTGQLTITQNPQGFSNDPSVQFSTGGTNVAFTIPAGSTQAVFTNGGNSVLLQTGSVANTITITPAFNYGGFSLTPNNAPTLQFTVPPAAPQLSNVIISQIGNSGFTLQIAGVATARNLTKLNLTFTAAANYTLAQSSMTVDVTSVATNWFQSGASNSFGGQFVVTVPFTLTSNVAPPTSTSSSSSTSTTTNALFPIQSVSVTAANAQGTSNSVSTQF